LADRSLVTNHPISRQIRNILALTADSDFQDKLLNLTPERLTVIRTAEQFARQLKGQIERSSDSDVSISGLSQVNANLTNVWNELSAFNSNGNPGHLDNAGANLDGALSTAAWAFFKRPLKGSKAYGETIATVRKSAQDAIEKVRGANATFLGELNDTRKDIEEQRALISDAQSKLDAIRSSADTRLDEISSEFARIKSEIEEERSADRQRRDEEFKLFLSKEAAKAKNSTEQIKSYEDQAKKILQIVGNIGLTGNFQKRSIDEADAANFWRWVTVIIFGAGILLITASLLANIFGTSTLEMLFIRLAIGFAITLPAIYTAREFRSPQDKFRRS